MLEIEQIILEHKDKLYRLCLYLEKSADRAEELFQDTWLKVVEKFDSYNPNYPFYPWLTKITVNTYRDHLRRIKLELKKHVSVTQEVLGEIAASEESLEKTWLSKERTAATLHCIKQLPDKYKLPLLLVAAEEMSYKEAAFILKIDENLLKSRLYQGRQKLKILLCEEGLDD